MNTALSQFTNLYFPASDLYWVCPYASHHVQSAASRSLFYIYIDIINHQNNIYSCLENDPGIFI